MPTMWVPGRKGKKQTKYFCGNCGKPSYFIWTEPGNFCTWCGSKMDGVQIDLLEEIRNVDRPKKRKGQVPEEKLVIY